jgi:hypothetical protein
VDVLYYDDFSESANQSLHGRSPDIGSSSWIANDAWKADGSIDAVRSTATVPFIPEEGYVYRLSASMNEVVGDDYWLAMGFTAGSSTAVGDRFLSSPTTGQAWLLRRGNTSALQDTVFLGPGTANPWDAEPTLDRDKDVNFQIILDTRSAYWQVEWLQKLTTDSSFSLIQRQVYAVNPSIAAAGFACGGVTISGRMDDFLLERIRSSLLFTANGQPADVDVFENGLIRVQAMFTSDSAPIAAWYKNDAPLDESDIRISTALEYDQTFQRYTASLTITDATLLDEGAYFCVLQNDEGLNVTSDTAMIRVNQHMVYWPLGIQDYSNGQYVDAAGGYNADVEGQPVFVPGPQGVENDAVQIMQEGGWATVPYAEVAGISGRFSITFWYKENPIPEPSGGLLIESVSNDPLSVAADTGATGQWQWICITYDGSMGRIYRNVELVATELWTAGYMQEVSIDIGHAGGDEFFLGSLSDIHIFNYTLNDAQISSLYLHNLDCTYSYASQFDVAGPFGTPDCIVNLYDFGALDYINLDEFTGFIENWLSCGLYPDCF